MKLPKLLKMSFDEFRDKRENAEWFVVKGGGPRFKEYFSWREADQYLNSYGLS